MSTWECNWRFQNAHMQEYGRTGTLRVNSESEDAARSLAKCAASRFLFGTTAYQTYVGITGILDVNPHHSDDY